MLTLACGNAKTTSSLPPDTTPLAVTTEFDAIEIQPHPIPGVSVQLTEVLRTRGDILTAHWSYRNETLESIVLTDRISETYIVDSAQKKRSLVVRDANGLPVTSTQNNQDGIRLPANQTVKVWAKFGAPSDDVDRISVCVQNLSPFHDIPIGH